jgi:hypothetical protein
MDDDAAQARAFGFARLFTVDEANALLPTVIPLLTELKHDKEELDAARAELDGLSPAMRANGHGVAAAEIEQRIATLLERLTAGVRRITAMGIELKDLNQGLIDFPHKRGERVVFLCWHLGEGPLAYWHEIADGFAGRQPLD